LKAVEANFLAFLKKSPQFMIPIYQRSYSWTERECAQLWDDIMRTGKNDKVPAHFVGSIVYVEKSLYQVSSQSPLLVIDGQQRLTTVTLLIEAIARAVRDSEPVDGFSAKKLRSYYLRNPLEEDERSYKLLLSQTDKTTLKALLNQQDWPSDYSIRIRSNYEWFHNRVSSLDGDYVSLCNGLGKLMIVDISLSRDQDNPQLIFESLNSTGRELTQADLVRNFVLMGLEPGLQTRLYEQYWRPMEVDFGQEEYVDQFDSFMRHYLTVKTGEIPNVGQVYEAFKQYSRSMGEEKIESLVSDVRTYASYYCAVALGKEEDAALGTAFRDIRELRVDVAFPFLLELYSDYAKGTLEKGDLLRVARLVESYVFRRAVCDIPTNSMNKTFATFMRGVKKEKYVESIEANFMLLPSYRRFPSDNEFKQKLQLKDLYNFRSRSYWLRRFENHDRKEAVPVEQYTIEHIMPQNPSVSPEWMAELGPEWKRVWETYLHRLGNLTLTGYNSEYSDRSFSDKRDMKGGFAESPLRLNGDLGRQSTWNEKIILERGEKLALEALDIWPSPSLSSAILDQYRPQEVQPVYTIADHSHIAKGPMHELFMEFRKQVLDLDPCVTEEYLKLYVAYKAETNFVDVIPLAKRLRLSLNMPFQTVVDPKGICRDVSDKGRWGNGDVEADLPSIEELPYVMGLVRQALERQLGNEQG